MIVVKKRANAACFFCYLRSAGDYLEYLTAVAGETYSSRMRNINPSGRLDVKWEVTTTTAIIMSSSMQVVE
jgi:hypothetical protein